MCKQESMGRSAPFEPHTDRAPSSHVTSDTVETWQDPCRTNGPVLSLGAQVRFYGTGKLSHKLSGVGTIVALPSHGDHCVMVKMESGNALPISSDRIVLV